VEEFEFDVAEAFEGDGSEDDVTVDMVTEFEAALNR
jgi:hypothetical protein